MLLLLAGSDSYQVTKTLTGLVTQDSTSGDQKWSTAPDTDPTEVSVTSSESVFTTAGASKTWYRSTIDDTHTATKKIRLKDFQLCANFHAVTVPSSPQLKLVDTSGETVRYTIDFATTDTGTTTFKDAGGTTRMSVAQGIAAGQTKQVILYRDGNTFGGSINGVAFTSWTDSSPPANPLRLQVVLPASSEIRLGSFDVGWKPSHFKVRNCPAGGSARIYNSAGTLVTSGSVSSGSVTLSLAGQASPLWGTLRVYDSGSTEVGYYTGPLRGGDEYTYQLSDFSVIGLDFAPNYATTQANAHNGAIYNGTATYGLAIGRDNSLIGFSGTIGGRFQTAEVKPPDTIPDQHAVCDIVKDSSGYLHAIYGGYDSGAPLYYMKSNTAYGWNDWGTATAITGAAGLTGGMMITSDDKLHLVASNYHSIYYFSKASGGSWSASTLLVNGSSSGAANWTNYFADCVVGVDDSLNVSFFVWDSGGVAGGVYRNSYLLRSTDSGATWKGASTSTYLTPMTRDNTTGLVDQCERIYTGDDAYIARLACTSDGTVHAAQQKLTSPVGTGVQDTVYHYRNTGTGWGGSQTFTNMNTGAALEVSGGGGITALGAVTGSTGQLRRYYSQNNGSSWVGPTTMMTGKHTTYPPQWYWSKLTYIPGQSLLRVLWQARNTTYVTTGDSTSNGDGSAALYIADVPAVPTFVASVAIAVAATSSTRTKTQPVAIAVKATGLTTSASVAIAVTSTPSPSGWIVTDTSAAFANEGATTGDLVSTATTGDLNPQTPLPN